jgi:hypothetical protein
MATLSTYLDNVVTPFAWSSCHQPIIYEGEPQTRTNVIMQNNAGRLQVTFSSAFSVTLSEGELLYIGDGVYKGFHTIRTVNTSVQVVLETTYQVNDILPRPIKYCPKLNFELYTGYDIGEQYATELPLTKIADLTAEINTRTIKYKWDVSGFLKSTFQIKPPTIGVDFNLFNRYRLYFQDQELESYQVANAAIEQDIFNQDYVNTDAWLNNQDVILFTCGKTIASKLENNVIVNYLTTDNETVPEFEPTQFNNQFSIT